MESPTALATHTLLLAALLVLTAVGSAHADPTVDWVVRYNGLGNGNCQVMDMAVDAHDCTYVTGYSSGVGWDFATVKYSPGGRQLHAARYGGAPRGDDVPYGLALDARGDVYVCGYSAATSQFNADFIVVKYDSTLTQQWIRIYTGQGNFGYDAAYDVVADSLGNVYACGESFEPATDSDMVTVKYDADGNLQWVERYNGPVNAGDAANAIAIDRAGSVFVTGITQRSPNGGNMDFTTLKYSSSGVRQWAQIYNGPANGNDGGQAIALDGDGNVYVTGQSTGIGTRYDATTIKYSPQGAQLWLQTYDGNRGNDAGKSLVLDSAANVYVTGIADPAIDYLTIKYDTDGNRQWLNTYHGRGSGASESQSVAVDSGGNVYVTGYSDGSSGMVVNYDYATLKYDASGVQQWVERYDGTGDNIDVAVKLALDSRNNVIVAGWSTGTHQTDVDFTTIKYDQGASSSVPTSRSPVALQADVSPNPFADAATLRYRLEGPSMVRLTFWDPSGRMVRDLSPGMRGAGPQEIALDGAGLARGIFLYRLEAGSKVAVGKVIRD